MLEVFETGRLNESSWCSIEAALDKLPLSSVQELFVKASNVPHLYDSTGIERLGLYCERRLRAWKESIGVYSQFDLNEISIERFLRDSVAYHPTFGRRLSYGEMYSLMKYGDGTAIEYFASLVVPSYRTLIREKDEWCIVAPGYVATTSAAFLLASAIAVRLDIPVGEMRRTSVPKGQYGEMNEVSKRWSVISEGEYLFPEGLQRKVILFEDSTVSGSHVRRLRDILMTRGHEVHPRVLVSVNSPRLELENALNSGIIAIDKLEHLVAVMNHPSSTLTVRASMTILCSKEETIRDMASNLHPDRLAELYRVALHNGFDGDRREREGLLVLSSILVERGIEVINAV